jgi:hypothetical protein
MLSCRFYDFPVRICTTAVIIGGIGGYYPARKRRYAAFTLYQWLIRPPILSAPASIVRPTLPSGFNPMQMIPPYYTMSIKVAKIIKYMWFLDWFLTVTTCHKKVYLNYIQDSPRNSLANINIITPSTTQWIMCEKISSIPFENMVSIFRMMAINTIKALLTILLRLFIFLLWVVFKWPGHLSFFLIVKARQIPLREKP